MRTRSVPRATPSLVLVLVAAATSPLVGGAPRAETWYADAAQPDDSGDGLSWATAKRTIGATITASTAGDTILVKYGTYAITDALVLSGNRCLGSDDGTHDEWDAATPDSSRCTIEADRTCRVMSVTGAAVTALAVIRGLTLTGGDATGEGDPDNGYGGGLDVSNGADPLIERCRITANLAGHTLYGRGGGISVRGTLSSPEIRECRIDANIASTAWFGWGGGVYFDYDTAPNLHDCVLTGNWAATARMGSGGAVATQSTLGAAVRDCQITGNIASTLSSGVGGTGGAMHITGGTVVVEGCSITANIAAEAGGGQGTGGAIYVSGGTGVEIVNNPAISGNIASEAAVGYGGGIATGGGPLIQGNVIEGNYATTSAGPSRFGAGGGVYMTGTGTRLLGNVIAGNTASVHGTGRGGGIFFESTSTIERNFIRENLGSNDLDGYGGGAYTGNGGASSFRNNTLVHNANSPTPHGAGSGFYHESGGTTAIENNIFAHHDWTGSDGVAMYSASTMTIRYNGFHASSIRDYSVLVTSENETAGDPRFADEAGGDFSLAFDSPCIESGNPATAVPADGGWRVDLGATEYTGTRQLRAITGPGEYLFGGQVKAKVNVTDPGTLSQVDIVAYPGEHHPLAPAAIARWYAITGTGAGATFDLTLSYLDSELGGAAESDLAAWRYDGLGWQGPAAPAAADTAADWLTLNGQTVLSDWTIASGSGTSGVASPGDAPAGLALAAIRPNPCRGEAAIAYRVPRATPVRLVIYDGTGRLVRVLVEAAVAAGEHGVSWDGCGAGGRPVAAGVYLCELRAGPDRRVAKILRLP